MKMLKNLFATVVAALACSTSFAYTDCNDTVIWVVTDAGSGSNIAVGLASGSTFIVPSTDSQQKLIMSNASLAMVTGAQVTARYNANGLTCSTATARTDLINFYVYKP